MAASTILEKYKGKGLNKVPKCSLISDCSLSYPRSRRSLTNYCQLLLSPPVHSCDIINDKEEFYSKLREICLEYPIVILRGLSTTLKIDLNVFSTEILVKTHPDMMIDVRKQIMCSSDENWDMEQKNKVWECVSSMSRSTIRKYAKYQIQTFLNDKKNVDDKPHSFSNVFISSLGKMIKSKKKQTLKFATNVDLSNAKKWKSQLNELTKLPSFLRIECDDNILTYVGYDILGMNTVQLYMKVPGCRTTGHQENNNFCSVNINIGPGDCEWFAVPYEYWSVIHSLCEQNNVNFLSDCWWPPDLDVLHKNNVPVYRFFQKPGDIVWVNVGCVHWVQAIGYCNNISWNVGPFTARQYELAIERYEWNKLQKFRSIVPMVQLSWNLARYAKISDQQLFRLIKNCLKKTMIYNYLILEFLKGKDVKVQVVQYNKQFRQQMHYCKDCEIEVFNLLICKKKKEKEQNLRVYCLDCALNQSSSLKGFYCLQKYHIKSSLIPSLISYKLANLLVVILNIIFMDMLQQL